jgi:hypothetical protein
LPRLDTPVVRVRMSSLGPAFACVGASLAAAAAAATLEPSINAMLISTIALSIAVPFTLRVARGRVDLLEPAAVAGLCFLVMYVLHPAAYLSQTQAMFFKGYDFSGRITWALVLIACGVAAFQLGYAMPWARTWASRLPSPRDGFDVQMTAAFAFGLAALATLLFSFFLIHSGGTGALVAMLQGRSGTQATYYEGSSAYFWAAPELFWPASLLLFAMGISERRRGFVVWAFVLMLPLAVFAGAQGARIVLIPLLATPAVYYTLATGKRPRTPVLLICGYLFFTLGIAYFRESRNAGDDVSRVTQIKQAVVRPQDEYRALIVDGVDNDMFESLAVETLIVPEALPIRPLDFVYRTAAKPIPRVVWPNKPLQPEELLTHTLYPRETTRASSSSGVVGNLFQFGGLPGVIGGMMLIGALMRVPWEYFRRFRSSPTAHLLLASFLMFIPILLRGAIGETLSMALFTFVPLLVAVRFCQLARSDA